MLIGLICLIIWGILALGVIAIAVLDVKPSKLFGDSNKKFKRKPKNEYYD